MNNLSQYIIEKLYLNKNIGSGLSENDKLLCVCAQINVDVKNREFIRILLYVFKLIEIKDNNITYYSYITDRILTKPIKLNSNGYYEYSNPDASISKYISAIFLDKETGDKFLDYIEKDFNTNITPLYHYFDNNDEWIDDYEIHLGCDIDKLRDIRKELNEKD